MRPLLLLTLPPLLALAPSAPALAHHPMGGTTPRTLWHGLLSGFGHPVIGLDHLAFVIAAGVLAAGVAGRAGWLLPPAFLAGGVQGTLLHLAGIGLGPVELTVAASLLAAGGLLLRRQAAGAPALATLFAVAGLFHGHAYAEAVVGAEEGVVAAYLTGLALVQAAVAYAAFGLARRLSARPDAAGLRRLAGAAACAAGLLAGAWALAA